MEDIPLDIADIANYHNINNNIYPCQQLQQIHITVIIIIHLSSQKSWLYIVCYQINMSTSTIINRIDDGNLMVVFMNMIKTFNLMYEKIEKEISLKCYEVTWMVEENKATGYGRNWGQAEKNGVRNLMEILVGDCRYREFFSGVIGDEKSGKIFDEISAVGISHPYINSYSYPTVAKQPQLKYHPPSNQISSLLAQQKTNIPSMNNQSKQQSYNIHPVNKYKKLSEDVGDKQGEYFSKNRINTGVNNIHVIKCINNSRSHSKIQGCLNKGKNIKNIAQISLSNNKNQSRGNNIIRSTHHTEMKQQNGYGYGYGYGYKKISSTILQGGGTVANHGNYDEESNSVIGSGKKIVGVALNKWMSYQNNHMRNTVIAENQQQQQRQFITHGNGQYAYNRNNSRQKIAQKLILSTAEKDRHSYIEQLHQIQQKTKKLSQELTFITNQNMILLEQIDILMIQINCNKKYKQQRVNSVQQLHINTIHSINSNQLSNTKNKCGSMSIGKNINSPGRDRDHDRESVMKDITGVTINGNYLQQIQSNNKINWDVEEESQEEEVYHPRSSKLPNYALSSPKATITEIKFEEQNLSNPNSNPVTTTTSNQSNYLNKVKDNINHKSKVLVPKLKLEVLPNYHRKVEKSLNESLLAIYEQKHGHIRYISNNYGNQCYQGSRGESLNGNYCQVKKV